MSRDKTRQLNGTAANLVDLEIKVETGEPPWRHLDGRIDEGGVRQSDGLASTGFVCLA